MVKSILYALTALTLAGHASGDSLELRSNRVYIPVTINGTNTEALLDSAAEMTFVDTRLAGKIGLLAPGRVIGKKTGGGIGGTFERDIVVLKSITIAGVPFENVRAAIDPQPTAGDVNVGTSILRHFVLVIDFSAHSVWFEPR